MNAEVFGEWFTQQGINVYKSDSSYWHKQGKIGLQAFPYHLTIEPDAVELSAVLRQASALALRYSAPLESPFGLYSYHAIAEDRSYGMDTLSKWARKNVRRGMRTCVVEQIPLARLAEDGWELQCDTLDRQGRRVKVEKEEWRRRCEAAAGLPGFEAWGAYVGSQLAASVITFQMENWLYMLYQQCLRKFLQMHVNNALGFVVTRSALDRADVKSILYGLHSLDAPASVDEFKFRMGYIAKPVRQRVVLARGLNWMTSRPAYAGIRCVKRLLPGNPTVSKTEGMIRFCRLGKLPLGLQPVPPPLVEMQDSEMNQE
jgi:hypothetical protein